MANKLMQQAPPFTQLLFSIGIMLGSFLVFSLLSMGLAIPLFGTGLLERIANLDDASNIAVLKYFQVVQSIGLFIIPPFILAWFFGDSITGYLMLRSNPKFFTYVFVVLLMLSAIPSINYMANLNAGMRFPTWMHGLEDWMRDKEDMAQKVTEMFLVANTGWEYLINMLLMAVLPALGEELIFRGILQKLFTRMFKNIHLSIVVTAFIFSAIHIQFFGFVPRFVLGVLFGYMLVWSGSLWLPIFAHFVNNGLAVTLYYFVGNEETVKSMDQFGTTPETQWFLLMSFVMTTYFAFLIFRNEGSTLRSRL